LEYSNTAALLYDDVTPAVTTATVHRPDIAGRAGVAPFHQELDYSVKIGPAESIPIDHEGVP